MPFVSDDFVVRVVVSRKPSITVSGETKTVTTIPGKTVTISFYYDGGVGSQQGNSFGLEWNAITPASQPQTEPTFGSFNPPAPNAGRPNLTPAQAAAERAKVVNKLYIEAGGIWYWPGTVNFTMPSGQTADTTYNGEVRINY